MSQVFLLSIFLGEEGCLVTNNDDASFSIKTSVMSEVCDPRIQRKTPISRDDRIVKPDPSLGTLD